MGAYFYLISAKDENAKTKLDFYFETISKHYLDKNKNRMVKMPTIKITQLDTYKIQESDDSCCMGGNTNKKQNSLKMIFLGEKKVGKTNIIKSILGQQINKQY